MASKFEPKRNFRWILKIPTIEPFYIKATSRPSYSVTYETGSGLRKHDPMKVEIYDVLSHDSLQAIEKLVYSGGSLGDVELNMLDDLGNVIEKWIMTDAFIKHVSYGMLSYATNDPSHIELQFVYSDLKLTIHDGVSPHELWTVEVKENEHD